MPMLERGDHLLTSALTLGAVLVKPMELGREDLQRTYEEALTTAAVELLDGVRFQACFQSTDQAFKT